MIGRHFILLILLGCLVTLSPDWSLAELKLGAQQEYQSEEALLPGITESTDPTVHRQ